MFLLLLVFLCVVVARCGGTQDVFVNQIESSFDAIRLAMLNKVQTGFKPENLKKYSANAHSLLDTTYSKTGFVYLNVYLGYSTGSASNCSTAVAITSGVSVNFCKSYSTYYYKYQVTKDSCEGAVVEYFDDVDCLNLIGTSDLGVYVDSCEPVYDTDRFDHVVHQGLKCTSASTPVVPTSAFVRNYYVGTNCGKPVVAYDAYAAMTCLSFRSSQKVYIDCADSEAPVADIYGSSCEGEPTSTTSLSIDCSNNLEDDDHYLSPYLDGPSAQAARAGGGVTDTATVAVAAVGADPSLNNIATAGADTSNGAADVLRSRKTDAIGTLVAETVSARGICKVNLEKHEKTMSKGALAGIIIGVIVGVALLVAYLHYKIFKEDYEPVSLRPGTEMNFLSPHPAAHHAPQGTQQPHLHAVPPKTRPPLQRSAAPLSDTNSIWSRQAQNTQQDDVSVISDSLWSQKTNNTHVNPLGSPLNNPLNNPLNKKASRREPGALSTKV